MRRFAALALTLALAAPALGQVPKPTREVLVLASGPTTITRRPTSRGFEIQNLGPNPIYCALRDSADAVVGKARKVDADGGTWSADVAGSVPVYCRAATADQVTTAGTIVTEAI